MASYFLSFPGSVPAPHFYLGLLFSSQFGFYFQKFLLNVGLILVSFGDSLGPEWASLFIQSPRPLDSGLREQENAHAPSMFSRQVGMSGRKSLEGLGFLLSWICQTLLLFYFLSRRVISCRSHRHWDLSPPVSHLILLWMLSVGFQSVFLVEKFRTLYYAATICKNTLSTQPAQGCHVDFGRLKSSFTMKCVELMSL